MLPKEILEQIFGRLPTDCVARSRLVCKQWREVLSTEEFVRYHVRGRVERWVVVFEDRDYYRHIGIGDGGKERPDERFVLLFEAEQQSWHCLSISFLPPEFTEVVAASGGLLCMSGQPSGTAANMVCVCNPLSRKFRCLPELAQEPSLPVYIMTTDSNSFWVLILTGYTMALYKSSENSWQVFDTGLPYRPRSPVACNDGSVYGLHNIGSPWQSSWSLVAFKLEGTCNREVWQPIYKREWGEILDIFRQPRLLESENGKLFLVGGLRQSANTNLCSTFLILQLDLASLEWSEAARMPPKFFDSFSRSNDFKVFGGGDLVYFSSKDLKRLVVCDFSVAREGGFWNWVDDCPIRTLWVSNGTHLKLKSEIERRPART